MKLISYYLVISTMTVAFASPIKSHSDSIVYSQQTPEQALSSLEAYKSLQTKLGIQNSDLSYAMRKSLVMANLLIRDNGSLDLSLCPQIKSLFIPENPEEYEVNMAKFLDQLNEEWCSFFDGVKAPENPQSFQSFTLRALLSMDVNQPVTDRDAKVAVLSALLAPVNQGPVGDCFAVSDVIRDHEEYYRHSALDYQSLVMNGYLSRMVDGKNDNFFYLPALADTDRDQSFSLDPSALFDAPGFAAARDLMGAARVPHLTECIMQQLAGKTEVTPSEVISAMAEVTAKVFPKINVATLRALGEYGFSSLTNNPILRGVEAAFASMAEDKPEDSTRGNINACINQALQGSWNKVQNCDGARDFYQAFNEIFNASYRLIYNLDIPLSQVASDGSSSSGGFQLYQRVLDNPTLLGNRMATPEDLRTLVVNAILAAKQTLEGRVDSRIADILLFTVNHDLFLRDALWFYDPANQQEPDPVGNYLKLARTPMQSCDGDNPFAVDDVDTQMSYDIDVQSYTPSNPQELLTWCLELAKKAPSELVPMDSPQHAFNFAPNNPDILTFLREKMSIDRWIDSFLVGPGSQVSRKTIDRYTQKAITNALYSQLKNVMTNRHGFFKLTKQLMRQCLTVRDYANQLLQGLNNLMQPSPDQAYELSLLFDALLLQNLAEEDKTLLCHSAVRFAFTNWNEGTKDIYFCAYFNPRTEKIGFGTIFEDKTNLQPMDENAWVNQQRWDVDLKPAAPCNQ